MIIRMMSRRRRRPSMNYNPYMQMPPPGYNPQYNQQYDE
jgi:hypothetical protein